MSVTFDRKSSKDKMISIKHAIAIQMTMKDIVIKFETIELVRAVWCQLANIVYATIKKVLENFGYETS